MDSFRSWLQTTDRGNECLPFAQSCSLPKSWINLSFKSPRIVALKTENQKPPGALPGVEDLSESAPAEEKPEREGGIIPQEASEGEGASGLGDLQASLQGQQKHIVRCPPGNAFSIRIKEPSANRQGNDAVQTFLFSLVNGNNIYFAMDKQAREEKGARALRGV